MMLTYVLCHDLLIFIYFIMIFMNQNNSIIMQYVRVTCVLMTCTSKSYSACACID